MGNNILSHTKLNCIYTKIQAQDNVWQKKDIQDILKNFMDINK